MSVKSAGAVSLLDQMSSELVDLEEEGGGNAGRCGELKLAFVYSAPEDDGLNEKFKEASNTLQVRTRTYSIVRCDQDSSVAPVCLWGTYLSHGDALAGVL